MELPDQYSDTDRYLERIRRRRAEKKLPRNARDEMLELFVDRLNAGNVADAIRRTGATLVDVSSGVESAPGVKDVDKIAAFLKATRL